MSTFVTVGNGVKPFTRLLEAVKAIANELPQPIVVQRGQTPFDHPGIEHFNLVNAEEFKRLLQQCTVFITHGGGGSVFSAVRAGKKAIVVPRLPEFDEVIDGHQQTFAREMERLGQVVVVEDLNRLGDAVRAVQANPTVPANPWAAKGAVETVSKLFAKLAPSSNDPILLVSPPGGHLDEIRYFRELYAGHPHHFVLNKAVVETDDMKNKTSIITLSSRDWRFFVNLYEAWGLIGKHQPRMILTTGGGFSVAFALAGKLRGVPTVYIETWAKVNVPTATGRIMYWLTPHFFYQWPQVRQHFPKATCLGLLV